MREASSERTTTRAPSRRVAFESRACVKRFAPGDEELCVTEARVLRLAAKAGLAPRVLGAAPLELRTERVGRPYRDELVELARSMAKLHRLSLELEPYRHVPNQLAAYARAANAEWLVPHARGLQRACPLALCHGDIKPSNLRVVNGRVRFIDFEGARIADPAWDLAGAAIGLGLTPAEEDELVTTWAEASRASLVETLCRFHAWRMIGLVFLAHEVPGRERLGPSMRARLPLLRRRAREVEALLRWAAGVPAALSKSEK